MNKDREIYEETVIALLSDNQGIFYGHIIASCNLNLDNTFPAPAGVYFSNGCFNLSINPNTFKEYSIKERKAILVHEALHIILNHIGRKKNKRMHAWNVACDIAINAFIKDIPKEAMTFDKFNLEPKLAAENYYSILRQKLDDQEISFKTEKDENGNEKTFVTIKDKNGTNTYEIDSHPGDDKGDKNSEDVPQEIIDAIRNKIIERAEDKSRGLIPSDVQDEIDKMRSKVIDWKKYIRGSMSNNTLEIQESIKRRNRRFLNRIEVKGFIKTPTSEGIVILDTSGSMDVDFISKTLGEIDSLCKNTNSTIKIIQVDAEVKEVKEFDSKKKFKIKGRGGTYLYPAIEYIRLKKLRHDFVIVITDGGCENHWKQPLKSPHFFILGKKDSLSLKTSNIKNCKIFNI